MHSQHEQLQQSIALLMYSTVLMPKVLSMFSEQYDSKLLSRLDA